MSQAPPTAQQPLPPPAPAPSKDGGIDLPTLIITAVASAVAAYVCSKVWEPGTLASAAFVPVLVAIVKEGLRKPTEVVTTAVQVAVPLAGRRSRSLAAPDDPTAVTPAPGTDIPEPAIVAVAPPAITTRRTLGRRVHWRIAVITGLLGFAVCAASFTIPELLSGGGTTLFGGRTKHVKKVVTTTTEVEVKGKTITRTLPTETTTTTAPKTTTETTTAPQTVTRTATTTAPATTPTTTPTTETTPSTSTTAPATGTGPTTPTTPTP